MWQVLECRALKRIIKRGNNMQDVYHGIIINKGQKKTRVFGNKKWAVLGLLTFVVLIGCDDPTGNDPVNDPVNDPIDDPIVSSEAIEMADEYMQTAAFEEYMDTNPYAQQLIYNGYTREVILANANIAEDVPLMQQAMQLLLDYNKAGWLDNIQGIIISDNIPFDVMVPTESGYILMKRSYEDNEFGNIDLAIAHQGTLANRLAAGDTEREAHSQALHAQAEAMGYVGGYTQGAINDVNWFADQTLYNYDINPGLELTPAQDAAMYKPYDMAYQFMEVNLGLDTTNSVYTSGMPIDTASLEPEIQLDFQEGYTIVFTHADSSTTLMHVNPVNNKLHYNGITYDIVL
jgi:hypothetical protein